MFSIDLRSAETESNSLLQFHAFKPTVSHNDPDIGLKTPL